jgi:hypothetical protein
MRRSSWCALMIVAAIGWGIAGLVAVALVSLVGWLGILILGLAILLVALNVELDSDSPAWSATLLRRQYEQNDRTAVREVGGACRAQQMALHS